MMAYIDYVPFEEISERDRVADRDNIIQIHGVHSEIMRHHYDLYRELMYGQGPLTRIQREMIAVTVSTANRCHY
jgi:alkylhydroperoxidase family enzyme